MDLSLLSKCWWTDERPSHYTQPFVFCVHFLLELFLTSQDKIQTAFHLEEDWHPNAQSLSDLEPAELEQRSAHFLQQTQVVNTQELEYTPNMWIHSEKNTADLCRMRWFICLNKMYFSLQTESWKSYLFSLSSSIM